MESEKDCVLVHLIEPTETTDDFPSRFGGKPTWLADPQLEHLNCEICKSQLVFLCQLYSPLPMEWAYHRVLYVFYCEVGYMVIAEMLSHEERIHYYPHAIGRCVNQVRHQNHGMRQTRRRVWD